MNKRIVQFIYTLVNKDAMGNNTLLLSEVLFDNSIDNVIVYKNADDVNEMYKNHPAIKKGSIVHIDSFKPTVHDIFVLQYGIAFNEMLNFIKFYPNKKVMIYHNITPPKFIFDPIIAKNAQSGYNELKNNHGIFSHIYGDSQYNLECLEELGYGKGKVFPLLFEIKNKTYEKGAKNNKNHKTFIHVGRYAPNKKIENVVKTYFAYKTLYNKDCSLHLVGAASLENEYFKKLMGFIEGFGVEDVVIEGKVDNQKLEQLYNNADVYICMSEHEGFCIPLIEAMEQNLLVCAYKSCAVPETMNGAGLLFETKNYEENAKMINEVLTKQELFDEMILKEKTRLQEFDPSKKISFILGEVEKW